VLARVRCATGQVVTVQCHDRVFSSVHSIVVDCCTVHRQCIPSNLSSLPYRHTSLTLLCWSSVLVRVLELETGCYALHCTTLHCTALYSIALDSYPSDSATETLTPRLPSPLPSPLQHIRAHPHTHAHAHTPTHSTQRLSQRPISTQARKFSLTTDTTQGTALRHSVHSPLQCNAAHCKQTDGNAQAHLLYQHHHTVSAGALSTIGTALGIAIGPVYR
jgi:hypothetical protein